MGGWQINAINTIGSDACYGGLATFLGGAALRSNVLGDPNPVAGERTIDNCFNRDNVVLPPATLGAANGDRSSGAFGTVRSTYAARQMQLASKLVF